MVCSKKSSQLGAVLAILSALFCFLSTVWAEGSAVPGQSVGYVFLGMEGAFTERILGPVATVPC